MIGLTFLCRSHIELLNYSQKLSSFRSPVLAGRILDLDRKKAREISIQLVKELKTCSTTNRKLFLFSSEKIAFYDSILLT